MTPLKTILLAATAALASVATGQAAPLGQTDAAVLRVDDARGEAAIEPALREAGFGDAALRALRETARHVSPTSNRTFITYEQRVFGRPVHASHLKVVIEADGTLSQLTHRLADIPEGPLPLPVMASTDVIAPAVGAPFGLGRADVARREDGRVFFEAGDDYQTEPVAEVVWVADEDGDIAPATLMRAWAKEGNSLVHTLVDQNGRVLETERRTSQDSYVAYAVSPGQGNARVMSGGQADGTASPRGWLGGGAQYSNRISGYNVEAYADTNASDTPDGGGRRITNGVFGTVADLNAKPTIQRNEDAAVQNLFYQVNHIHDRLYRHGFTETAGNFQRDNYGRGGVQGDHIRAEALDGSGTNNANISVPWNDGLWQGYFPRMQMYRWTAANPDRASSFDGDIVWHEYAHGVLWRMVGDLDWPLAWATNEGFADALAIVATGNDRVGEWVSDRSQGIRSQRYGATSKTLSSYRAGYANRHANGEIYGAAIWQLREEFRRAGRSDDQLMGLMIEALNWTKSRASFLDMRDGLLQAGDGADDCRVWRAFAHVGMGEGASMSRSGSEGNPRVSLRSSSSVPGACRSAPPAPAPTPPAPEAPTDGWTRCAVEGGQCRFEGTQTVRYGANGRYVTKRFNARVTCSAAVFGRDPAPGVAKACDVDRVQPLPPEPAPAPEAPTDGWTRCAVEGGQCRFEGTQTVRYGANGRYVTKRFNARVTCSAAVFGRDPAPGVAKACDVDLR